MDEFEVGFLYRLTTGCNISYIFAQTGKLHSFVRL